MSKEVCDRQIIKGIAENYRKLEQSIVDQLRMSCDHHYVTIGSFREEIWKQLFEQIIPKKFSVARSVFIIDSTGKVSKEVDLAIFDEQYTPYIFRHGQMKYIPIEAVAVVVQCKSTKLDDKDIEKWIETIKPLQTSLESIARIQSKIACGQFEFTEDENGEFSCTDDRMKTTQTATRPLRILCHLDETMTDKRQIAKHFDFVIFPKRNKDQLRTLVNNEAATLQKWHEELNHANEKYKKVQSTFTAGKASKLRLDAYKVTETGEPDNAVSLLTLIFQLNQLLMLINNPIPFPHLAYVRMFNEALQQ